MATKKNPLSALLNSDERKQAEAFTRDHVTRSAVQQAGTYRVGVQQPLPISQTSLGRMSASLGTVSGILNQFSDYQSKKEQAELQGDSLQHKIAMQGIAGQRADQGLTLSQLEGQRLNEVVNQQNIKLGEVKQRFEDETFDQKLSNMLPAEEAAFRAEVVEDLRRAQAANAAAELAIARGEPSGELYKSLYDERTRRIMGATHGEDYRIFYAQKKAEIFGNLSERADALTMEPEAALKMNEDILSQFMEEKGLSADDAMGEGFIASVREFNKQNMPQSAAQVMEASKQLNIIKTGDAILHSAQDIVAGVADGGDFDIREQPWFIQLSSYSPREAVALLMGRSLAQGSVSSGKNLSVFEKSQRTFKSASEFQVVFAELSDTLLIDGKPMREHGNFLNWQADVDEAVEKLALKEAQDAESGFTTQAIAARDITNAIVPTMTSEELFARTVYIFRPGMTTAEQREAFTDVNQEYKEAMAQVPDEKVATFINMVTSTIREAYEKVGAKTNSIIGEMGGGAPMDTTNGFDRMVRELLTSQASDIPTVPKTSKDGTPSFMSKKVRHLLKLYQTDNVSVGGARVTAGQGSSSRTLRELDEDMDGGVSEYRNKLNELEGVIQSRMPSGAVEKETFQRLYREGYEKINLEFKDEVMRHLVGHVREREEFRSRTSAGLTEAARASEEARIAALKTSAKELKEQGYPDAITLDPRSVELAQLRDPTATPEEIIELLTKSKKFRGSDQAKGDHYKLAKIKHPDKAHEDLLGLIAQEKAPTHLPVSMLAKRKSPVNDKKAAKRELNLFNGTKNAFEAQVEAYTKPGNPGYEAMGETVSSLMSNGNGWWAEWLNPVYGQEVKQYSETVDAVSAAMQRSFTVSIGVEQFKQLASGGVDKKNRLTLPMDSWSDAATTPLPKRIVTPTRRRYEGGYGVYGSALGGGVSPGVGVIHAVTRRKDKSFPFGGSFNRDASGEAIIHSDWKYIKKNGTVDATIFKDQQPVTGIPFNGPPEEQYMAELMGEMNVTPPELQVMAEIYGFKDGLSFVKSQWNNAYYSNKRTAGELGKQASDGTWPRDPSKSPNYRKPIRGFYNEGSSIPRTESGAVPGIPYKHFEENTTLPY